MQTEGAAGPLGPAASERIRFSRSDGSRRVQPSRGALRVIGLGAIAGVVIAMATLVVLLPVAATHRKDQVIVRQDLPLQRKSAALRDALVAWQLFLEPKLDVSEAGLAFLPADISKGGALSLAQSDKATALSAALRSRGLSGDAADLDSAVKRLGAAGTGLAPAVTGASLTPIRRATIIAAERSAFASVWAVTAPLNQAITQRTATDAQLATNRSGIARTLALLSSMIVLLLILVATTAFAVRVFRRQRKERLDAQRRTFGTELQEAVDFTDTEDTVYRIVGRALQDAVPNLNVELLIADSSRAHFSRVLSSHENADGCGVVSPRECPAAKRAHTLIFPSSDALNACPYLTNRPSGSCSAACIPVSIASQAIGVMHATGTTGTAPTERDIEKMEFSTRRAAERVALIRTFETSETQARTDPLTGLLNRRSLENRVRELQVDGIPFSVAYGDLDLFKALKDTHGHEAGDQALRLFSRVMRDSVRPADLVSRYGGEEFVIVLPDCTIDVATIVLERVRERLALILTSGRVPTFTVSFGLASSADADTFDEIVAAADQALLAAKASGRDRVELATEPTNVARIQPSTADLRVPVI